MRSSLHYSLLAVLILLSNFAIAQGQILSSDGSDQLVWDTIVTTDDNQFINYMSIEQDSILGISLSSNMDTLKVNLNDFDTISSVIFNADNSNFVDTEGGIELKANGVKFELQMINDTIPRLHTPTRNLLLGLEAAPIFVDLANGLKENTIVGNHAGKSLISGQKNTFLGYKSGLNVIGSRNVCIGASTGLGSNIGNGNVIIGHKGNIGTVSNKLYINNDSGTPLIEGDFASNEFNINGTVEVTKNMTSPKFVNRLINEAVGNTQNNSTRYNGLKITAGQLSNNGVNSRFMEFYRPDNVAIASVRQQSSSSVKFDTNSDKRLKTNFKNSQYGLSELLKIHVRDYNFINEPTKEATGFIAQQLHDLYPHAVSVGGENPKTGPWRIDYGKLTPLIAKSIQDQDNILNSIVIDLEELEKSALKNSQEIASIKEQLLNK